MAYTTEEIVEMAINDAYTADARYTYLPRIASMEPGPERDQYENAFSAARERYFSKGTRQQAAEDVKKALGVA